MKLIDQFLVVFIASLLLYNCGTSNLKKEVKEVPVVIANDSLAYEITILDLGFNLFLNSVAHPKGYYSQQYLETRNQIFSTTWNIRATNPMQFNANIYENIIDYEPTINYGYHVNYMLFNYFMFAQQKYNINLGAGYSGRIR